MADDIENDDQWLYGEGDNIDPPAPQADKPLEEETSPVNESQTETHGDKLDVPSAEVEQSSVDPSKDKPTENGETIEEDKQNGDGSDKEDYDEDSDDDVNVVIGDIKTSPTYASLNIKRGGLLTTTTKGDKTLQAPQPGKFSVEEFEQVGLINGIPANEFNLDSLEDKPWRKPGADITDYFNYGFNEDTWRAYCERQKRMRVSESGTGLLPLNAIGMPRGPVPIMNDNSKYSGAYAGIRKAGPPPGRRMTGSIDVIGGATTRIGVPISKVEAPKENVIQVMTADRREYSRKPTAFPDMSVPPPTTFEEFHPEYDFNPEPEPFYGGYEPTQDLQWGGNSSWQPQEIKTLTPSAPGSVLPPTPVPPVSMPMNTSRHPPMPVPSPVKEEIVIPRRSKSKEKESVRRDRDRSRDIERDRDRERSHRRDRSRSRSRRHKSRSRSPNHRSHRKKKSRRHDDSD